MNEFRWNNFSVRLFSDNSSLYLGLKDKLEAFKAKEDIQILRDVFHIFTRENLSCDYLSLKLVTDNIPSLLFEINPYRIISKEFLITDLNSEQLLSDLSCILLVEDILRESKPEISNRKVLRQLAFDIYHFWKESLMSYSVKDEKIPSNIKNEYDSIIRNFIKRKGNKKIEIEYLYDACAGGIKYFLSKEEVIQKFGREIIIYGVSEVDPLHFKVLEILSNHVSVTFYLPAPKLEFIHNTKSEFTSKKLKELIPEWNILNKFWGDKTISEIKPYYNFKDPSLPEHSKFQFFESQESYREIEFVGRQILRLIEQNQDQQFRLTSIKVILPAEDLNYSLLVSNTFDQMGIPFAFTKDIRKKKSPYFSAVVSLLKLALSDFDKESIFSLFYNPCFFPIMEDVRVKIKPEIWNQIISRMNLFGYLDKHHKKNLGYRESNVMTWESLWSRLNLLLIGDSSEDSIIIESELLDELFEFLEISSSLLQDLIGFKEDFSTLSEFSNFFRIILDTYLHPVMRYNKSEEVERLNERAKTKIYSIISNIESIDKELKYTFEGNVRVKLEDFVDILLLQLESWTEGDSRVLKNGVVIGELMDVIDPSFDYVFLVGLDERRMSVSSQKFDSIILEDLSDSSKMDSSLKLKYYFYHILNHKAKEYHFSYVSLDTIKDKEYYPSQDVEYLRLFSKEEFKKIPLFSYLEYKGPNSAQVNFFEKNVFDLINLKKREFGLPVLKNSAPQWDEISEIKLKEEIESLTSGNSLNKKIKSYFFRLQFDENHIFNKDNNNLSVNKFINYLECPKKFFFNNSIYSEEEHETLGELDSIDSLRWHVFIKEVITQLNKNPDSSVEKIINKIFSKKREEYGEIPIGLLRKIAEIDFENFLRIRMIPFFTNSIANEFRVFENIYFNKDINKTKDNIVFSTPSLWSEPVKLFVDYILVKGDTVYLTFLTTAKEIKDQHRIKVGFSTFLLNFAPEVSNELKNFLGVDKIELAPAFLHFPRNSEPRLLTGKTVNFTEDMYKPFWDGLLSGKFPAFPMNRNARVCEYCPVNTVCHGHQNEFLPFLELEMAKIIEKSKDQFLDSPKQSEKKESRKSGIK